jgi:hypothetical protein
MSAVPAASFSLSRFTAFKIPGDLGFAFALPKPPGFFCGYLITLLSHSIFSTGFFASKFLNGGTEMPRPGPAGLLEKNLHTPRFARG